MGFVSSRLPCEDVVKRRDDFVRDLRQHIENKMPGCTLRPFGSAVNGLWLADSDLDLSVEVPHLGGRVEMRRILKHVASVIHRVTRDVPEQRLSACVPILHWV